jgi:putative membrane protein
MNRIRAAVLLAPVLIATVLLSAADSPAEQLHTVTAAVVNNDEPVQRAGQTIPLGRELAGRLVNHDGDDYTWVLTDAEDASAGLRSGAYAVAVTIPRNFSAAAVSTGGADPAAAEQARVEVTASRTTAGVDPIVTRALTGATVETLNRTVVETYLDNVYVGFTRMHDQLGKAADGAGDVAGGAGKLADGSDRLVVGLGELAAGSGDLADGLDRLTSGSRDLADGVSRLDDGAGELATGTRRLSGGAGTLATGTGRLATGADRLADGAGQLSDGAGRLSDGLGTLRKSTVGLPGQTRRLADGARQVADGNRELADTVVPLADKAIDGIDALPDLTAEAARAKELADQCETPADLCARLRDVADRLVAGAGRAESAKDGVRDRVVEVKSGINALADGSEQVADGAGELAEQTPALVGAISRAADGAGELETAAGRLADGAGELSDGAAAAATGASRLADGAGRVAGGADQLADGTGSAAKGADRLADGTSTAATGASHLTDGARRADAAGQQLADGSDRLADGAGKLATSLDEGRDQVPAYTPAEREHLKTVAATPIAGDLDLGETGGRAAGAIIVIALWVGAMLIFVVVPSAATDPLTWTGATWRLAVRNVWRPFRYAVAQAVVVSAAAQLFLGFEPALVVVATLISITFVVINQALLVAFGNAGRVVAAVVPAITLGTAVVSGVPGWLTTVDGLSPGHGAVLALRAVTAGAGLGPVGVALVVAWLVAGTAGYLLGTARRRYVLASVIRLRQSP